MAFSVEALAKPHSAPFLDSALAARLASAKSPVPRAAQASDRCALPAAREASLRQTPCMRVRASPLRALPDRSSRLQELRETRLAAPSTWAQCTATADRLHASINCRCAAEADAHSGHPCACACPCVRAVRRAASRSRSRHYRFRYYPSSADRCRTAGRSLDRSLRAAPTVLGAARTHGASRRHRNETVARATRPGRTRPRSAARPERQAANTSHGPYAGDRRS